MSTYIKTNTTVSSGSYSLKIIKSLCLNTTGEDFIYNCLALCLLDASCKFVIPQLPNCHFGDPSASVVGNNVTFNGPAYGNYGMLSSLDRFQILHLWRSKQRLAFTSNHLFFFPSRVQTEQLFYADSLVPTERIAEESNRQFFQLLVHLFRVSEEQETEARKIFVK